MSLTLKLFSLAIRTVAKPIGNTIKRNAKEHERFRQYCVAGAQWVHRVDMRMRLGILHDPEAQQRMHDRERRAAEEKKRKAETPTVRSELEQKQYEEQKAKEAAEEAEGKPKEESKSQRPRIRPLSEARAIELGANFFSEAFIFAVAVGVIVGENWWSRRKAAEKRDEISDRIDALEADVEALRRELDPDLETLHALSERIKEARLKKQSWWNPRAWVGSRSPEDTAIMEEEHDYGKSVEVEAPIVPIHEVIEQAKATAERALREHTVPANRKPPGTRENTDQKQEKNTNANNGSEQGKGREIEGRNTVPESKKER